MEKNNISIVYERNKQAITFATSGAYGGPAPDHSGVVVHFYLEYPTVPHSSNLPLKDKVVDFGHEEKISRGDITREIQATTYLSPELAIVIGNWLIKNGEEAKERRTKNE